MIAKSRDNTRFEETDKAWTKSMGAFFCSRGGHDEAQRSILYFRVRRNRPQRKSENKILTEQRSRNILTQRAKRTDKEKLDDENELIDDRESENTTRTRPKT